VLLSLATARWPVLIHSDKIPTENRPRSPPQGVEMTHPAFVQDSCLVGFSRAEVVGFCVATKVTVAQFWRAADGWVNPGEQGDVVSG